jgi:CO/xanthine dehydrogenase Mo-binding subunit
LYGQGRYLADINADRRLWAVILRLPHAYVKILSIDTAAAAGMSGVHGVLTGVDYRADGMGWSPAWAPSSTEAARKYTSPTARRWPSTE